MTRHIAVFCGSSVGTGDAFAELARTAARGIARAGFGIVYGGGRIGLMGVLADAALEAGVPVVGVIPRALSTAEIAHGGITELVVVESMHERKAEMARRSDGFVALPGGFGTMDEFFEILTWRQLGIHDKPVGLLDADGYYDPLLELFAAMERNGFVRPEHRGLFTSATEIGALLRAMGLAPA